MSLTARRDRIPSGRSNIGSAREQIHETPRLPQLSPTTRSNNPGSTFGSASGTFSSTSKSDISEIYRKRQEIVSEERARMHHERSMQLGPYNEFSVPRKSQVAPLRTVFLDPAVNNFPKSKTRSELMDRIRKSGHPDMSYDIDNDGFVSQEDYKLSKVYDLDCNGVLERDEILFGQELRATLRSLEAERKRKEILDCLTLPPKALALTKHNYFTNKFDPSAWNDFDAIPRSASHFGLDNHGGSRKRLVFSRTLADRSNSQNLLDNAYSQLKVYDNRRTNQITDVSYEND